MPRKCTICVHERREAIDAAIIEGETYRNIAQRFAISMDAVGRHARGHLPKELVKAKEARAVARADDLLARLDELAGDAMRIKDKCEKSKRYSTALTGIRELVRIVRLQAELVGELKHQTQVNIVITPQWTQMRAVIVTALEPYPEAKIAAAHALLEAEKVVELEATKAH